MGNQDKRIESRYIDGGAAKSTPVQKNAVKVHWISYFPEAVDAQGLVQIYDGFDNGGKLKWQQQPGRANLENFKPPIPCDQGLFIYNDAALGGYTVGYEIVRQERGEG